MKSYKMVNYKQVLNYIPNKYQNRIFVHKSKRMTTAMKLYCTEKKRGSQNNALGKLFWKMMRCQINWDWFIWKRVTMEKKINPQHIVFHVVHKSALNSYNSQGFGEAIQTIQKPAKSSFLNEPVSIILIHTHENQNSFLMYVYSFWRNIWNSGKLNQCKVILEAVTFTLIL